MADARDPIPDDRMPVRSRAIGQLILGAICAIGGLAIVTRTGVGLDTGWTGRVPAPIQSAIGALNLLLGLYLVGAALVWIGIPFRQGAPPPVVHFEPDCVAIRGCLVPKTFIVQRAEVREIGLRVLNKAWGHLLGLGPMALLKTTDGKGRGVQHLYEGDPRDLVADLARWASAPIGPTKHGVY